LASPPTTSANATGMVIDPDFGSSTPPPITGTTGSRPADRPNPVIRTSDSATSADSNPTDQAGLRQRVESAFQRAGLTLEPSGVDKLKELESKAETVLSQKHLDATHQAKGRDGLKTLADAIITEAKAHPEKPITAEFIQSVLGKLCPLFPFC
jgi:hypothetical protein